MAPAVVADPRKCTGCRICEVACRSEDEEGGFKARVVPARIDGRFFYAFFTCVQCESPACVAVCPTRPRSMRKQRDGVVVVDEKRCIGCGYCAAACPYGAVKLKVPGGSAVKCDLCLHRLRNKMPPACVEKCPVRALSLE